MCLLPCLNIFPRFFSFFSHYRSLTGDRLHHETRTCNLITTNIITSPTYCQPNRGYKKGRSFKCSYPSVKVGPLLSKKELGSTN